MDQARPEMWSLHLAHGRPLGHFSASRTCIADLSWNILITLPSHGNWDLSLRRGCSTFKVLRVSQLRTLSRSITPPWTLRKNPISAAVTWDSTKTHDPKCRSEQSPIWKLRASQLFFFLKIFLGKKLEEFCKVNLFSSLMWLTPRKIFLGTNFNFISKLLRDFIHPIEQNFGKHLLKRPNVRKRKQTPIVSEFERNAPAE